MAVWDELAGQGFFTHLPDARQAELKREAEAGATALQLLARAGLLYTPKPPARAPAETHYAGELAAFEQASRNLLHIQEFQPEPIPERQAVLLRFKNGERRYEFEVQCQPANNFYEGVLGIINRALADLGAGAWFYAAQEDAGSWGYLLLTDAQLAAVRQQAVFHVSRTEQDPLLARRGWTPTWQWTTEQITGYVDRLRAAHLLDYLPLEMFEEARQSVLRRGTDTLIDLLARIPGLIFTFDTERINDVEADYRRLVLDTAALSHGFFTPEDIRAVQRQPGSIDLSFQAGGYRYGGALIQMDDWVDMHYLDILNEAMVVNGRYRGRFNQVTLNLGQYAAVFFLDYRRCDPEAVNLLIPFL
jgi:hypothetical protein